MNKSIVVLLGLLVVLLPVGSSMTISNVMAFEDYGYDNTDQYMKYAEDMTNNNYYKPQSDSIQKIKCNNINSNFNGIEANMDSANPLGGLGAESLEADDTSANVYGNDYQRTNGNFDVDCINNNDNTGIGPAGVQGPSGITQLINGTNIYLVQDIDRGDGIFLNGLAICDPGDFVLNGGYTLSGNLNNSTIVNQNGPFIFDIPSIASPGQAWGANVVGLPSGLTHTLLVNAYCFDNPPLRP